MWLLLPGLVAVLTGAAAADPAHRTPLLVAAVVAPVLAAIIAGQRWARAKGLAPAHVRAGWCLLAVAAVTSGGASIAGLVVAPEPSRVSAFDLPVAASWVFAVVGLLSLIGGRVRGRRIDSVVEALLVTAPIAYLAVALTIDGRPTAVSMTQSMVMIGAVAGDVILVVLAAELVRLQHQDRRSLPAVMVFLGTCFVLAGHAARTGLLFSPTSASAAPGLWLAALSAAPAVLWSAASLHPSTVHHVEGPETFPAAVTKTRVAIVLVAIVVGPAVLAVRMRAGHSGDVAGLALGAVAVAAVAVAYLLRLVEQRARIEHLALHDDLCGIPNRVLLGDRIATALAQAPRHEQGVALLFLDLDRFKTINDSLGHAVGNDLLRAAAIRLQESVRSGDTVARLGGDEFAVLLPDVGDPDSPAMVAEKVLEAFSAPFELDGRQLFVSPSIGVSLYPDDASNAEELLKNADAAMYRAKENGRNTFEIYTREINARAHQRLTLENSLHKAADRGELVMYYQPKVDLRSGHIVGMEALMRWEHPELGLLLPREFIALAEETGLIVPVGEWALEQACAQTKAWADAGYQPLTVAVNLSARQFQHQQVGDMVARVLRSTALDPRSLELELTESLALQDPEAVIAVLEDLKRMGVQCSIDDFGTGYSGLMYLTRFPIDRLKIDKFFISEISSGGDNARIVAAVIALAHGLRLDVTAEGVESDEQRQFLHEHGCDEMQGFLFSEAIPATEFEKLLLPADAIVDQVPRRPVLRVVGEPTPGSHRPSVAVRVHGESLRESDLLPLLSDPSVADVRQP